MKHFNYQFYYRLSITIFAVIIVLFSIAMSRRFVNSIAEEEHKKVEHWANAIKILTQADFEQGTDFEFIHGVVESNTTVPCILTDENGNVLSTKNVDAAEIDTPDKLAAWIRRMNKAHKPIEIHLPEEGVALMYYDTSDVQRMLQLFPLALLGAAALFVLLVSLVIRSSKQSEQNMVWIGMAKETAHQLGTPISSLMGWLTLLHSKDPEIAQELEKDVVKLEKITTRFSKIGLKDDRQNIDVLMVARICAEYMQRRVSKNVEIVDKTNGLSANAQVNATLWEWVIENLIKNAIDAIGAEKGTIEISAQISGKYIALDVKDSGRGIPTNMFRKIFMPGYTTKSRGWGIGLSLCRRIVEGYYRGKIYVLNSAPSRGTTMRVTLRLAQT
jgi:C4-dicarboxylate-specific signal transduction histidine kinase